MENTKEFKTTLRKEKEKKELITHLNRIEGQINGIKKMITENRYCDDVLIQLSAVNSSVKSLANKLIEKHLNGCVVREIENGNTEIIAYVINLIKRFQ